MLLNSPSTVKIVIYIFVGIHIKKCAQPLKSWIRLEVKSLYWERETDLSRRYSKQKCTVFPVIDQNVFLYIEYINCSLCSCMHRYFMHKYVAFTVIDCAVLYIYM